MTPSHYLNQCWNILLIGPLGTNFSEILIEIHTFSFKKMHLKMSFSKMAAVLSRPQCVTLSMCLYELLTLLGTNTKLNSHALVWVHSSSRSDEYITVKPLVNTHHITQLKCFSSCLADFVSARSIKGWCQVGNEDVVGAAPIGDAPTTSGDHFTKKRASFQSELAFSFTTVCRKLASFSKKLACFFRCFTKLLAFCDPENM